MSFNFNNLTDEQLQRLAHHLNVVPIGKLKVANLTTGKLILINFSTNFSTIKQNINGQICQGQTYEHYAIEANNSIITRLVAIRKYKFEDLSVPSEPIQDTTFTNLPTQQRAYHAFLKEVMPNAEYEILKDECFKLKHSIEAQKLERIMAIKNSAPQQELEAKKIKLEADIALLAQLEAQLQQLKNQEQFGL